MAKKKSNDWMDQILTALSWLVDTVKGFKEDMDNIKKDVESLKEKNTITPKKEEEENKTVERETPYKVMQIQDIRRDESYADPALWWEFKIYAWLGKTFKNKKEALDYVERATSVNPGIKFDIFPV